MYTKNNRKVDEMYHKALNEIPRVVISPLSDEDMSRYKM